MRLAAFLFISNFVSAFSRVLVIGATGRVGQRVVSKLTSAGIDVVAFVRDLSAAQQIESLKAVTLKSGSIHDLSSLISAAEGCTTVIDVHGCKPPRFSKPTDILMNFGVYPKNKRHPYFTNFIGVKNVLEAMKTNKVGKLIRITGSLVDTSSWSFATILFNTLLSFTVKWHEATEMAIRNSGVAYTVIRPPGIRDERPASAYSNRTLTLRHADDKQTSSTKKRSTVTVDDLATLCVLCGAGDMLLSNTTVICGSAVISECQERHSSWDTLIAKVSYPDSVPIQPRNHRLPVYTVVSIIGTIVSIVLVNFLKTFLPGKIW